MLDEIAQIHVAEIFKFFFQWKIFKTKIPSNIAFEMLDAFELAFREKVIAFHSPSQMFADYLKTPV